MTRLGKIARLSREIREELNVRLQNGEVGRKLVEWLNGLPAAQAVLAENFGGRAISTQNLSEWKQGGYEDWVRHQENCAYAVMLTEMSDDLEGVAGETRLEDRLAAPMAMALARLLREAEEAPAGAEQRRTILDVARQLSQLRRESHQAERVRMERERWAHKELELLEEERHVAEDKAIVKNTMAEFPHLTFGLRRKAAGLPPKEPGVCRKRKARRRRAQSGRGKSKSSRIQAVGDGARPQPKGRVRSRGDKAKIGVRQRRNNTRAGPHFAVCLTLPGGQEGGLSDAAPGESNQIKPNQTSCEDLVGPANDLPEAIEGGGIQPGQTESNLVKPIRPG